MGTGSSKTQKPTRQRIVLTRKQNNVIAKQQSKSLCYIKTKTSKATGFLCKIPSPVLITNNHVLDKDQIKIGENIEIFFTDEKENKNNFTINIDEKRTTYTIRNIDGEEIDTTIIELRPDKDKLNNQEFMEIDDEFMNNNIEEYENKNIYMIYYKNEEDIITSIGIINKIECKNKQYTLLHNCDNDKESSGCPIILYNHKVIGLHRGLIPDIKLSKATLLQYPIKEFNKKLDEKLDEKKSLEKIVDNEDDKKESIKAQIENITNTDIKIDSDNDTGNDGTGEGSSRTNGSEGPDKPSSPNIEKESNGTNNILIKESEKKPDEQDKLQNKEIRLNREKILEKIRNDIINDIIPKIQEKKHSSLQEFIDFLNRLCEEEDLNDFSKAYLVYKWVCLNINLDIENKDNNEIINSLPETIFSNKKAIMQGFAKLFSAIIEKLNITVKIINGYERGIDQESKMKQTWNIIYINGNGYFIESLWGSGNVINGEWKKQFSDYYFCPNPEEFIFTHFPDVPPNENIKKYTLLPENNNICNSRNDFNNLVKIKRIFFLYNLKEIIPNTFNIEVDDFNKAQIMLKFNNKFNRSLKIFCDIFKINEKGKERRIMGKINENDLILFNIYFQEKGDYELRICKRDVSNVKKILAIQKATVKYNFYRIDLIDPNTEIFKGSYTDFKFEINLTESIDNSNYYKNEKYIDKLYINTFGKKIKLKKDENYYTAESLFILNSKIQLYYYNEETKSYVNILKIKTKNAENGKELSYPKFFELTDDMVLFSPISEKLEDGKKYNFKIKSNQIKELIIINEDKINIVNESNDGIFEIKDLQVEKGKLKVNYTKEGDVSYILAYLFSVE